MKNNTSKEYENILEINHLQTSFFTKNAEIKAVDGLSFTIPKKKTLGVVGESGSGKSITSLSIMRLIDNPGKIVGGEIYFKGEDLLQKSESEMRKIRGNEISMIFQEPMTSLNPTLTVGQQISESYITHQELSKKEAKQKSLEMLKLVGIPSPKKRLKQYPHELSGGMRQRIMIAMALACDPDLLIADEPTTALDVTIQAQILDLINELQDRLGMGVLLITHDLGIVAETCDYVAVMYGGQVMEFADVKSLFTHPKHPYTVGLMKSIPPHDRDVEGDLDVIKGSVPSPVEMPNGCRFAPRCPFATDLCHQKLPNIETDSYGNQIRCWIYSDEWDGDPEVNVHAKTTEGTT
ncbi:ABC transporter ATP-binding protein [Oceanobacillus salinisoli]|uniref:ABC transporter ATP-binding protein n=1 Tax=Oceanobacillus salinisoli TaxID=2678611 RepID=UPI0012E1C326|nr:ABC transporter ATP-binding protein [Oceanobacillus salinisoli]